MLANNYCRNFIKKTNSKSLAIKRITDHINSSVKFLLPDDGRVMPGIDPFELLDNKNTINLPYKKVCIEYTATGESKELRPLEPGQVIAPPRIIFAEDRGDMISLSSAARFNGIWCPYPWILTPKSDIAKTTKKNRNTMLCINDDSNLDFSNKVFDQVVKDMEVELEITMGLIAALQCANVTTTDLVKKLRPHSKKPAHPFDTYKILTITTHGIADPETGNEHISRSPREHLRRGHVRRIQGDRRIWVQSTIVNAGNGGAITKSYRVKAAKS